MYILSGWLSIIIGQYQDGILLFVPISLVHYHPTYLPCHTSVECSMERIINDVKCFIPLCHMKNAHQSGYKVIQIAK